MGNKTFGIVGSGKRNTKMSSITWMGTGGMVSLLLQPRDIDELLAFLHGTSSAFNVIGLGSKIVVRDGIMNSVVIKLGKEFSHIKCDGNVITVGCAAPLKDLVVFARENAISGFEFCTGIPGTVGGAISTNVHAYGCDIVSLLQSLCAVNEYGEMCTLSKDDIQNMHTKKVSGERWVFVEATFVGKNTDSRIIKDKMNELTIMRHASYPMCDRKTIGYVFKSSKEYDACALITEAGCRGLKHGHAIVSEKHCNFIESTGRVTAGDIEDLCNEVKDKVRERMQVNLECDIEFWGARAAL